MPFKPNKRYTMVALYASAVAALSIILGTVLFNLNDVLAWLSVLLSVLSPILYGLIAAFLLRPLVSRIEHILHKIFGTERKKTEKWRRRSDFWARLLAISLTFIILFAFLFCFFFFLVPLLVGDGKALVNGLFGVAERSLGLVNTVTDFLGIEFSADDPHALYDLLFDLIFRIRMRILDIGTQTAAVIFNLALGLCLSAGILFHRKSLATAFRHFGAAWLPLRVFRYLERMAFYSNRVFGKYLVGKIVECTIVGLIYLIILSALNYFIKGAIPYPFLITMVMTITNFVPIIGAFLGGIPCGILILTGDKPFMVIWFAILVLAIEQLDGNLIFPKVIGSIIDLRAVWIMVAVALFGGMFGVVGMFLSPPLFSIIYMLLRDFSNHRLAKKGMVTDTDYYTDSFASTAPPRKRRFKHHFHIGENEREETNADGTSAEKETDEGGDQK